jgi:hypothetical protein
MVFGSPPWELELALVLEPGESSTTITDFEEDEDSTTGDAKSNVNPGGGFPA